MVVSNTEQKAKEYAVELHERRRLNYGDQPYEVHLRAVADVAHRFIHLVPEDQREAVLAAAWCHDTLEDCAITYNDLRALFGPVAADIVYDVTNELGKNRAERAEKTYPKIRSNSLAVFVKLCDRAANTVHSRESGSSMFAKYQAEYAHFREELRRDGEWEELWAYLDEVNSS